MKQQAALHKSLKAVVSAQIEETAASMQLAKVRGRRCAPGGDSCGHVGYLACVRLVSLQESTACGALAAEEAAMKGRHSNHVKALRDATEKKAAAVSKVRRQPLVPLLPSHVLHR